MGDGKSVSAPGQQVRAKKLSLTGQTDLSTGHSSAVTYSNVAFHLVTLAPYCDAVLGMDFFNQARLQLDYQVSALGHHTCTGLTVHPQADNHIGLATGSEIPLPQSPRTDGEYPGELFVLSKETSAALNAVLTKVHSGDRSSKLEQESKKVTHMIMTEFKSVFTEPDGMPPPIRDIEGAEHTITFEQGKPPPKPRPFIRLSQEKEMELEKQVQDMIKQGYIRPSQSRFASATFLVPKADGGWRMVVDYRAVNNVTVKDSYPLPLAEDLFTKMKDATVFSKIDLKSGFYQIPLAKKDWDKTAFRTSRGLYEYTVVPMGLCNAPATFMRFMNNIFRKMIDEGFVVVFMDDIVIYSKSIADHAVHLRRVLTELKRQNLYAKASKCTFFTRSVQFLGHILTPEGVHPMPEKQEAINAWPVPKDKEQLRSFLGLCNYYSKFINGYSRIAAPLTQLTGSTQTWEWDPQVHTAAFEQLKTSLNSAPCLIHPRSDLPFVLGTDASDFAVGAVLMQDHGQGLQPIGFYGRKLNKAERNYAVYDKEMLAVVYALNNWHYLLESSTFPVRVMTDHQPLSHFATAPVKPNLRSHGRWQRWLEQLGMFKLDWNYVKGTTQWADPISRRPDYFDLGNTDVTESHSVVPPATWSLWQHEPTATHQNREPPATLNILSWMQSSAPFSAVHHALHQEAQLLPQHLHAPQQLPERPPPAISCRLCKQLQQDATLLHRRTSRPTKHGCDPTQGVSDVQATLNQMLSEQLGVLEREGPPAQLAAIRLSRQQLLAEDGREGRRTLTLSRYLEPHEGRVAEAPPPDTSGNIQMPTRRCAAMVQRWSTTTVASQGGGQRRARQLIQDQCRQLTRFGAYCWTHLAREEHLRVKGSSIPGAGKGVFATTHIRPGEVIGLYTGDLIRDDFSRRDDPSKGGTYYLQLNSRLCIDGARTDAHVSRFINDPRGSGQRPNCTFAHDGRSSTVRVRATRHIQPGQELLISYGRTYWDAYHHVLQSCGYTTWSPPSTNSPYLPNSSSTHLMAATHVNNSSKSPTSLHFPDVIRPYLTGTASLCVLDTLAETAFSVLAAVDTALYCSLSADYLLQQQAVKANRRRRKRTQSRSSGSLSALTTQQPSSQVDAVAQPQTHSPQVPWTDSPSLRVSQSSLRSPPARRLRAAAVIPPVVPNVDPPTSTPAESSTTNRPDLRTTNQDPPSSQSYSYIDKWVSQVDTTEFSALVQAAAATDPEYQAMVLAARLIWSAAVRNREEDDLSSVTSHVPEPFVRGRLIKRAAKHRLLFEAQAKVGWQYEPTSDGLLYLRNSTSKRLIIPKDDKLRTRLLAYLHDHDGHHGRDKVVANAKKRVWWQGMDAAIRKYVTSCPKCLQVRASQGKEQGMAMPLEAPQYPWQWVTMDFVGPFPLANNVLSDPLPETTMTSSSRRSTATSSSGASSSRQVDQRASNIKSKRGNDMILVFVDRFTKMKHFVACRSDITAQQTVQLFEQHVVRLHGWPEYLTTDRGSVFTSKYWKNYFLRVGVKLRSTTAYHPQTDGQSEREIKTLIKVLSSYVNTRRDDWDLHLALVEFAINSTPSVATGKSPFKINYGVDANKPIDIALARLLQESHNSRSASPSTQADCTMLGQTTSHSRTSGATPTSTSGSSQPAPHPHVVAPDAPLTSRTSPRAVPSHLLNTPSDQGRSSSSTVPLASSVPTAQRSADPRFPDVGLHALPPVTDFVDIRQAALHVMGFANIDDSNPAVDARLAELQRIVLETRLALQRHQETLAAAIAKRRRPVNYTVGQQVMLSSEHLVLPTDSTTTSTKLRPNYVGPYSIIQVVNPNAVRLQLNPLDTFHSVVNVSRLKPFEPNPPSFADRPQPVLRPPPAIGGEGQDDEWNVESIVGHRFNKRKKRHEFCVKWLGYDEAEATWEPIEHLYDNQYFLQYITEHPLPTAVHTLVHELQSSAASGTSPTAQRA
jgi:hypothetical protein